MFKINLTRHFGKLNYDQLSSKDVNMKYFTQIKVVLFLDENALVVTLEHQYDTKILPSNKKELGKA